MNCVQCTTNLVPTQDDPDDFIYPNDNCVGPCTEHRNVVVELDGPNVTGTLHHRYVGPAALVQLGTDTKGRSCDYVGIDAMTCVLMKPGYVKITGAIHS